jgi:hypothetical protein
MAVSDARGGCKNLRLLQEGAIKVKFKSLIAT